MGKSDDSDANEDTNDKTWRDVGSDDDIIDHDVGFAKDEIGEDAESFFLALLENDDDVK